MRQVDQGEQAGVRHVGAAATGEHGDHGLQDLVVVQDVGAVRPIVVDQNSAMFVWSVRRVGV